MKIRLMSGYDRLNNIFNIMKNYRNLSEPKPINPKTIKPENILPENIKPEKTNKIVIKK